MPAKKGKPPGGSDPPSSASDSSDTDARPSKVKRMYVELSDDSDNSTFYYSSKLRFFMNTVLILCP